MLWSKEELLKKIHMEIENIIENYNVTYLDAILKYSEDNNIETEIMAKLIKQNSTLKEKLQEECENLNLVEKTDRLPLT